MVQEDLTRKQFVLTYVFLILSTFQQSNNMEHRITFMVLFHHLFERRLTLNSVIPFVASLVMPDIS